MTAIEAQNDVVKKTIWSSNTIQTAVILGSILIAGVSGWNQIAISKQDIIELKHDRVEDSSKIADMAGDIKAIRAVMERNDRRP